MIAAILAALLASCSVQTASQSPLVVAGAIRPSAEGSWYVIDDDGHQPLNVAGVDVRGDVVTVHFSVSGSQVITFVATPDETLARQGYRVGASVSRDEARITIAPAPDYAAMGEWANIWFYGLLAP